MKKNYKARLQNNRITGISVPVHFFRLKRNGVVYAECPALRIVTYGRTVQKAKEMFADAYALWKEEVNEKGDAKAILENLGWEFTPSAIIPSDKMSYNVPIHLLSTSCLNLDGLGNKNGSR